MKSIKAVKKYTLYTLSVILLTVSLSSFFALVEIHEEAISQAKIELNQRMRIFRELLEVDGTGYYISGSQLYFGSTLLNGNFSIPDKLTSIFGGTFTIFMGDTRVSTSIRRSDGSRIVGTKLVGPAYDAIFENGVSYHGEADIQGIGYITAYEAIKGVDGSIIGVLYTGVKKDDYLSHYNKLRVGIIGILFLIVVVFSVLYYYLFKQGKRSEQKIASDLAFLQTLLDTIPNPVFYKDVDGKYLGCNNAFESLFGVNRCDVIGKTAHEVVTNELSAAQEPVDRDLLRALPGTKYTAEAQISLTGGIKKDIVISKACFQNEFGTNAGIIGSLVDVTEHKNLQKIMIKTEKMLLIGSLTAGTAHELNNPLSSILQNTQNIQRRLFTELKTNDIIASDIGLDLKQMKSYLEQRGIYDMLEYISTASIRAAEIVSNMLSYCRKETVGLSAVSLQQLVDSAFELCCTDYDIRMWGNIRTIKFIKDYDKDIPAVFMNRSEIEQVVINLIKNAVQALNEKCSADSARIILRTRQTERHVVIEVEDNGPGISQEDKWRIFEPFFTTKEVGSGVGMGLSVAYALVVNNHNGDILVDSQLAKGTKFSVVLPLVTEEHSPSK